MVRSQLPLSIDLLIVALIFAGCQAAPPDEPIEIPTAAPSEDSNSNTAAEMPSIGNSEGVASKELTPAAAETLIRNRLRKYYTDICSDDETTRIAAFDSIMFEREHLAFLFGKEDADVLWDLIESTVEKMRSNTAQLKDEISRGGDIVKIDLIDVRKDAKSWYFADVLSAIPETVPIYRAITTYANGPGGGSSSYLVVDGRVVWIQGLDSMYYHLKKQPN